MSSGNISATTLAAAVERRTRELPSQPSAAQLAAEHERRQSFRRLIDPGIVRPNSKDQVVASLKTLLTIAENLLREPENAKYQQFKPTNAIIKKNLMDPKGALEYAIEVPVAAWFSTREDLRIGAAILKEFVDLESERADRAARSKVDQKAVAAAVAQQVKLAYMDDRKTKMINDEREKERRAARAAALARQEAAQISRDSEPPSPTTQIPGSGSILSIEADTTSSPNDDLSEGSDEKI
ncbi:hypothetical protein H0H92_009070 [Tricholoma furcatifolium]|nr:hypothetical protein H0H92_009070 [Tricholoma furcatifolium]